MGLKLALLSFAKRIFEDKGLVKKIPYASILEKPTISYSDLLEIYEKDDDARLAIDFFANLAVGVGHYTTSDPEHDANGEAKRVVDEFAEGVNLDYLLLQGARELIAFGISVWEKITPENLQNIKILPISSKWQFQRDEVGNLKKIIQVRGGRQVSFKPSELIVFNWCVTDAKPYGRGLLHNLAETIQYTLKYSDGSQETLTLPSLYKIKAMMRDDLRNILHYNVPRAVWYFEDADEEFIQARASDLKKLRPGEAIATNKRPEIQEQILDPRGNYEQLIRHFEEAYWKALQTPICRLFTTADFNRASAQVVQDLYSWMLIPFQRYVKRVVEREIYWPVLIQAGFDPQKVKVRLNWGSPERPEFQVSDLLRAVELGVISVDEARDMLSELGWKITKVKEKKVRKKNVGRD